MDSSHGHDAKTRKAIIGLSGLAASQPAGWGAHCQLSVQTATYESEKHALKVVVAQAVTLGHHL